MKLLQPLKLFLFCRTLHAPFSHYSFTLRYAQYNSVINLVNSLILSIFAYRLIHEKV